MLMLLAAATVIVSGIPTHDQDQLEGTFDARLDRSPYINVSIHTEAGGYTNWGRPFERSELRAMRVDRNRITFTLVRPAGTFSMQGKGSEQKLRGNFDFTPSAAFRKQMATLGFSNLSSERMFVLAVANLSIADVRYLEQSTSDKLTTAQLVKMLAHGVDPEFVKGMEQTGFRNLSSNYLIRTRDHGVTPQYIAAMMRFGYRQTLEDYIRGKDHGVNEKFAADMRELGFELSFDELVTSRDRGVGPDFVQEFAGLGYTDLSLHDYLRLRDHGVSADFAWRVNRDRGERLSANELIRLRDHGGDSY
jgi:hypothetical protein